MPNLRVEYPSSGGSQLIGLGFLAWVREQSPGREAVHYALPLRCEHFPNSRQLCKVLEPSSEKETQEVNFSSSSSFLFYSSGSNRGRSAHPSLRFSRLT